MRVAYEPRPRLWLLSGVSTSYAVRLDAGDCLRHVHWGARVTLDEAVALAEQAERIPDPAASSFEQEPGADELPVEGGARFGPAALQLRWADLSRGIEWKYLGYEIVADGHLRVDLADRHYPLTVKLHYRIPAGSDVVERWTEVTNIGHEVITLERCDSAAWTVATGQVSRLSHLVGAWNSEFRLHRTELPVAETVLTSRRGLTSHHANPWLALDDGTAGEERGEV